MRTCKQPIGSLHQECSEVCFSSKVYFLLTRASRNERDNKSDIAMLGSKGTPTMVIEFPKQVTLSLKDFGKRELSFMETSFMVDHLLSARAYDNVNIVFNKFKNALTYLVRVCECRGSPFIFQ